MSSSGLDPPGYRNTFTQRCDRHPAATNGMYYWWIQANRHSPCGIVQNDPAYKAQCSSVGWRGAGAYLPQIELAANGRNRKWEVL